MFSQRYESASRNPINAAACFPVTIHSHTRGPICQNTECLTTSNQKALKIFRILQSVKRFFHRYFDIDGLDDFGKTAPIIIEWDQKNASWTCSYLSCFFQFHNDFILPEVVVHEWIHGVIHHLAPLHSKGQPGALNESLADVFALVYQKFHMEGRFSWKIVDRNAQESPGTFRKAKKAACPENDFGYVHENSKIPTHAFYLAVQGLGRSTPLKNRMLRVATIWMKALLKMNPNETFTNFAKKTIYIAERQDPRLYPILIQSWNQVDIHPYLKNT